MSEFEDASSMLNHVRGIQNTGNTCFLNAVLQALVCLKSFHTYMLEKPQGKLTRSLLNALQSLLVPESTSAFNPRRLMEFLSPQFRRGEQNDAHELLICLLADLENETSYELVPSIPSLTDIPTQPSSLSRLLTSRSLSSLPPSSASLSLSLPFSAISPSSSSSTLSSF